MDKRTIFFVAALSLTLFVVNIFFTYQNQEQNKEWVQQQEIKKSQQQNKLAQEISQRTAKVEQLPLVTLYSDKEGKQFLSTAVESNKALVALAWSKNIPSTVYAKKGQQEAVEYHLASSDIKENQPIIFSKNSSDKLRIGSLPEVGKYDLQLIFLENGRPHPLLAEYVDAQFILPSEKLENFVTPKENALALLSTPEGYLPVGVYHGEDKSLWEMEEFTTLTDKVDKQSSTSTTATTALNGDKEKYYVLETEYQQLVFSTKGGALVEINLPFKDASHPNSIVKPIQFDREILNQDPVNAHFPLHAYYTPGKDGSQPEEHATGKLGGYYPLIRRDLMGSKGRKTIDVAASNYALNFISEYPEVSELIYEVKSFDSKQIVFEATQSHRKITKTFSVQEGDLNAPYTINLTIKVDGDSRGLWLTTGIPEAEWISGSLAPALKLRLTRNDKTEVQSLDLPKDGLTVSSVYPDWIGNSNGFLGIILQPLTEIDAGYKAYRVNGTNVPSRLVELDQEYERFNAADLPGYAMALPLKSGGSSTMKFRIFAGPFAESTLKAVDKAFTNPETGQDPDYIAAQSFHGWFAFISEPFAKFLFVLMKFFHFLTGSWGFSIILLTVALRVMLYPLNAWSMKSMAKMQQIAPEVTAIQERYKKDPKKAQLEVVNLYREKGINPISGCFPLLIQMPFLIGMFDLLKSTFELRGASFIPGWIDDLAAPDVLFSWKQPIFFIGNEFHLLPILLGAVMYFQQRLMSSLPKDPSLLTDQQRQQKAMGNVMTVVFAVMFYNFPSGLNIYWLSSMLLGILQQWITNKQMKNVPVPDKVPVVLPAKQKKK